jgi:tyrosyl-tRNA synthetase
VELPRRAFARQGTPMSAYKSEFLRVLAARGFIHQVSEPEALDALAQSSAITGYIGFDCTAPSLHVGNLVSIMMLYWMQQTGHRPIALMGGGTTRVGDPSGKDESRKLLDEAMIAQNLRGIRAVFDKFLKLGGGPGDAIIANNADWLNGLNYIDFLREVGPYFSVNRMLNFESVKLRLERDHELSFLEFNYMILQAYDFVELYRRTGCVLQMGGSDQWGNIINGIELGRRMFLEEPLFGLTSPLITTSSGAKMGKTAAGAVWLNPDMVSPYEYSHFWRNTEDADVTRFLKLFTILPLEEIDRLAALQGQEINEAKEKLAKEATALVHGPAAAEAAAAAARTTFDPSGLATILPSMEIPAAELVAGIPIPTVFVRAGLVPSTSEARRQIREGGLRINDIAVRDERALLTSRDITPEGIIKLSFGKKRHVLLKAIDTDLFRLVAPATSETPHRDSYSDTVRRLAKLVPKKSSHRVTEHDVADAASKVLAREPDSTATIQRLVQEIPNYLELSAVDMVRSKSRPNEALWEQQIRNIRSHHSSPGNFIYEGFLKPVKGGLQLTQAGRDRLKNKGFIYE